MSLRKCRQRKNGQDYAYWQLVESCRSERGPRQRVVAHLDDEPRKVFDEIAEIQMVDVLLPTRDGVSIRRQMRVATDKTPSHSATEARTHAADIPGSA